jgi:hypothetical protein
VNTELGTLRASIDVVLSSPPVGARESWFEDRKLSTTAITSVIIPKMVTLFVRDSSLGHSSS